MAILDVVFNQHNNRFKGRLDLAQLLIRFVLIFKLWWPSIMVETGCKNLEVFESPVFMKKVVNY